MGITTSDRLTRQLVLVSLMAALVAGRQFMRPETGWAMAAAFVVTASVSLVSARAAAAIVLVTAFIAPALVVLGLGFYYGPEAYVWNAALAALVAVRSWNRPWAIPSPMRAPLVTWALVVACTWPVVLLREANFSPALMQADGRFAGSVWIAASWIGTVASNHMLGILWFDWMFRECVEGSAPFESVVARPMLVSWLATIALGVYQATVNMAFVNGGAHLGLGRASGGLMDANPYGAVAALLGPIAYVLATRSSLRGRRALAVAALALSWYGMWVSGSRGAFGTAVIGLLAVAWAEATGDARKRRWTLAGLGLAVALVAVLTWAAPVANSPIQRLAPLFRGLSDVPLSTFLSERWDPYFYGHTAWRALEDSPLVGIGLGTFPSVVGAYSTLLGHPPLVVDNAQNWFRHQFTELGLLGSLGWACWVLCAGVLLVSRSREVSAGRVAKGAVAASAAVSLIGMPGQSIAFILVFWTCAFFLWQMVEPRWPQALLRLDGVRLLPPAIALLCAAGTVYVGMTTFAPARRAARFGEFYGAAAADFASTESSGHFTMKGPRAIAVVHPASSFVKITVSREGLDGGSTPVRVAVDRAVPVDTVLGAEPAVQYATLRLVDRGVVIDARAPGAPTGGLRIDWEFLPPPR
ncbi:MAG: hypothetical protein U0Q55_22325 [Vicinamibacterales bacterium]